MISIIVPIYNVATYLPQCLDSLIAQTYRDIEIICVNDGSTDNSLQILETYAQKDERIQVINQKNQGLSNARNTGIVTAQGEWIMFVDSDDWLDTHCCETVTHHISTQTDLCFFSYIREYKHRSLPQYIFAKEIIHYQEKTIDKLYARLIAPTDEELRTPEKLDSLSTAWGKLYKTSIIKEHALKFIPVQQIGTEDLLFNVYYFTWIQKAIYLPNLFYHYRKDNITSLTKLYKPHLSKQWNTLFQYIENWINPLDRGDLQTALLYRRALSLIGQGLNITFGPSSFIEQHRLLSNILYSPKYQNSIKLLPTKYFPVHWKIFFIMARYQYTTGVLCLLKVIQKIIQR